MSKDDIVQAVVIAIGCSATTFLLVFMMKMGVKQESLFALGGTLIGAASAIVGAAWLSDRNRNLEKDAEVSLLMNEYGKLLKKVVAVQTVEPATGATWPATYKPLLLELAEVAGGVRVVAEEALTTGKALTFVHRAAVRRVQFTIHEYLQLWSDSNAEVELDPQDERTFPGATAEIARECKLAIAELGGTTAIQAAR
jgi:hypothetical protein